MEPASDLRAGSRTSPSPTSPSATYRYGDAVDVVVIVGGGVIGLCTAYSLAKESRNNTSGSSRRIILLEVEPAIFPAASSHNTGCLHYDFHDAFGANLTELGKYSFELWQSIAENDPEFVSDTGYRSQSFFPIVPGTGKDRKVLPNWVVAEGDWDVDWGSKGAVCATVNPNGIGKWLERACANLGVEIRTCTTATTAILSENGTVVGLECTSAKTDCTYVLPCHTLVLAAGPWTPSLVTMLFPDSTLDLRPTTNAGDWILFRNSSPTDESSTAVVFFDDIVHEKLEYAGRNDATIWVCGRRNYDAVLPPPGKDDTPDENVISDLIHYSKRFIAKDDQNGRNGNSRELPILATGRAFRPFTIHGLPFISEIPREYILPSQGPHPVSSGVFISYGHGSYGITLGMGSGKLLAQVISGEKPDIDISQFIIA